MPIHTSPTTWILETRSTGYAFGLNEAGRLTHCYWGARLPQLTDYPAPANPRNAHHTPEEYPAYGGIKYIDPCLKLSFTDGVRDTLLTYLDFTVKDTPFPQLDLRLKDAYYPLQVTLHYRLHEEYDLIERWVTLENLGEAPMHVERVFSAQWHLPAGGSYFMSHLYGRWADEFHIQREALTPGIKSIESRRLITSPQHSSWFAIDRGEAGEEAGEVWFGTLAWSGNWKISAEVTDFASTRVNIGLNDWDFAWRLEPGRPLEAPATLASYTQDGFGAASRRLHDYVRDQLLPHGKTLHKVLYNSWEATLLNVDEPSQSALAEIAAGIGVELFVMDDGWFHGRTFDNAGLGDWWPDETKFPHGLSGLVKKVNDLGMDFGLWVEPEMVNPDSELYRAHPDWVLYFPTRPRSEARNQLILNLGREDVQSFIIDAMDRLLNEYNIAFIKWDMNRHASEPGWEGAPGDPREVWVRYVQGLYHAWGELRRRHPGVVWQSCASGGGRADLGILRLADQIWVSDNTEATARLGIQEGYSQVFPANTMEAWVTDAAKELVPLEFRFHVSLCGALGVGGDLRQWSASELKLAAKCIALYKEIRPIVQLGNQFRLISAQKSRFSAVEYLSKDKSEGALFVFRIHLPDPANLPQIYVRGLELKALYSVEGFGGPRSGRAWMEDGLKVEVWNLRSKVLRIKKVGNEK